MSLKGKTAIVTGAAGAVGGAVVRRFLAEGMNVVGVVRGKDPLGTKDARLKVLTADVTEEKDVQKLFEDARRHLGGVDILINTVGGFLPSKHVTDITLEEWDLMFRINLKSVFLCTREALRHMKGRAYGRIVNISAMVGLQPGPGKAPYAISKAGVSLLTEIASREVKGSGITLNAIAPSIIDTAANRSSMPEEDFTKWVSPESIAEAICYLCSDAGGSVTGTTLRASGAL